MLRARTGGLERLRELSEAVREASQPFERTISDQLGMSARSGESRERIRQARQRLARAEALLNSPAGVASPGEIPGNGVAVTFVFVALATKLALCDGPLVREEYLALRAAFPLEGGVCRAVRQLVADSCRDAGGAEHYARLLAGWLPREENLRAQALGLLVDIALADGPVTPRETALLWMTAAALGFSPAQAQKLLRRRARARHDPYFALGMAAQTPPSRLRRAYLAAMKRLHPDAVRHSGMLAEGREIAGRKAAKLNAAYGELTRPPLSS